MANFWIYRNKLNQESESLEAVVNDEWPLYISKGDIPVNNYTEEDIEYLEEYLEETEKQTEEENKLDEKEQEEAEKDGKLNPSEVDQILDNSENLNPEI